MHQAPMHRSKALCTNLQRLNEEIFVGSSLLFCLPHSPQWMVFWACVAWETKLSWSSVEGLNLLDNKDVAALAPRWRTALISPLQNKHVCCIWERWKSHQHPLCNSPCIPLTVSQQLMSANETLACGSTFSFGLITWHKHILHNLLVLVSASMFTLPNKPQLPGSSSLDSSIIEAKFITSTEQPVFLPSLVSAAAAAACHHMVTLQMEPGIHIIKTKMLGHNS